jgi:acyl-coenzyme A synthetase/AMP-(fatty) acid ligase
LFLRDLPKGPTGKVQRHELAKLIARDFPELICKS